MAYKQHYVSLLKVLEANANDYTLYGGFTGDNIEDIKTTTGSSLPRLDNGKPKGNAFPKGFNKSKKPGKITGDCSQEEDEYDESSDQ